MSLSISTIRRRKSFGSNSLDLPEHTSTHNRYEHDFEELQPIGRGAYGQVVKVRNRLDDQVYAIKKIRLPNNYNMKTKVLEEVRTLSSLYHRNVVRYYQAWIEREEATSSKTDVFDDPSDSFLPVATQITESAEDFGIDSALSQDAQPFFPVDDSYSGTFSNQILTLKYRRR